MRKLVLSLVSVIIGFCCLNSMANSFIPVLIRPKPGTIALTFDDGPNPLITPRVLRILIKYHAHATFFLVGNMAKRYPNLVKQILRDGNTIGSHSMTHKHLTSLSSEALRYEVLGSKRLLERISGTHIECIRPPFNDYNRSVNRYFRASHLIRVPIGLMAFDEENPGAQKIADCLLHFAKSGFIITMHDGPESNDRMQTVQALPILLKGLHKEHLGLSTICQ